jgi:hypothetical protein
VKDFEAIGPSRRSLRGFNLTKRGERERRRARKRMGHRVLPSLKSPGAAQRSLLRLIFSGGTFVDPSPVVKIRLLKSIFGHLLFDTIKRDMKWPPMYHGLSRETQAILSTVPTVRPYPFIHSWTCRADFHPNTSMIPFFCSTPSRTPEATDTAGMAEASPNNSVPHHCRHRHRPLSRATRLLPTPLEGHLFPSSSPVVHSLLFFLSVNALVRSEILPCACAPSPSTCTVAFV